MAKRLIACFDGTWNTPDDKATMPEAEVVTNVVRFYESVRPVGTDGMEQVKWYDDGVGTEWYNRLAGGAFGLGLSIKIREGYAWLIDHYADGDEIFVLGFSRGAYTARSLVGLIRNCGLLKPEHKDEIITAYEIYRTRDGSADSETALHFRASFSREVPIQFLGVWDTVGALGIPVSSFQWFNRSFFEFHDTELSRIVRNAYHAVAIDEHRKDYAATLWMPKDKPQQTVEQRWFIGAHADVGGGYKQRLLSDVTLRWMQSKAQALELGVEPVTIDLDRCCLAPVTDSYAQFLAGAYARFNERYFRPVRGTEFGNELVDESFARRQAADLSYRPKNKGLPL